MLLLTSLLLSVLVANQIFVTFYLRDIDITYDQTTSQMIYDQELGYITSPNDKLVINGLTYQTDQLSERIIDQNVTEYSKPTILLIGDSHVWGWGKPTHQTIQFKLNDLLQKNSIDYQVRTISDISYSSFQTYLKFLRDFRNYKSIKAIIWINGHNDSYNNSLIYEHRVSRPTIAFQHEESPCRYNTPPKRPLYFSRQRWANESMFSPRFSLSINPFKLELLNFFGNIIEDLTIKDLPVVKCTKEEIDGDEVVIFLNKLVNGIANKRKAKFLSVFVPNKSLYQQGSSPNFIFTKKLNQSGITTVDIASKYANRDVSSIFNTPLNDLDDHLSEETHELIAEEIFSFLKLD